MMPVQLHIISPERELVNTRVSFVKLPGTLGSFEVLKDHAPLISSLEAGEIVYGEERLRIRSGFVEVRDNLVTACVEL